MKNALLAWAFVIALGLLHSANALAGEGRALTTNDVLQITVLNQPEFNANARIEPDGTISLPYAGRIPVVGLTTGTLGVKIANILIQKGLVRQPAVSVELSSFGTQVSVLGAVNTPGAFTLDRPSNLSQALAHAGGIKEEAGAATVVLHRRGKTQRIDAKALLEGRADGQLMIQNNDEIYVEQGAIFYLYGFVNRPGQYPINRKDMTVRQAIAAGGGISSLGSDWWRMKIRRRVNGVVEEIPADLDETIQPDDTIVINERLF